MYVDPEILPLLPHVVTFHGFLDHFPGISGLIFAPTINGLTTIWRLVNILLIIVNTHINNYAIKKPRCEIAVFKVLLGL